MLTKLLPLAFIVALAAAGCANPPNPEPDFGSGQRFVTFVADPLNNAGVDPSVVVNGDGLPIAAYFAFEEETAEGVLPAARPVLAPTLPGVLMAALSSDGIWTRGAMALQAKIPNVAVPFSPGFDDSIGTLKADNVTGLQVVADGDTLHAVWGSARGTYYATGSADPASTTQFSVEQVSGTPPVGPSIAIVNGQPLIAFSTSTSSVASVDVATPSGSGWQVDSIADVAGCAACRTAVIAANGGPAVAYTDASGGVSVATNDGENGWVSFAVGQSGGEGLSGTATGDGIALSYYDGDRVIVATGSSTGPFDSAPAATVTADSAASAGASTSIAADDQGTLWVGWVDGGRGVGLASGDGSQFTAVETGSDTENGSMPSVSVTPDGSTAYVAWYDSENQDLLVGAEGDVSGLAIAAPSPEPSGQPSAAPSGTENCREAQNGAVDIVAQGIAFDTPCVNVPAGQAITIRFDNKDSGTPHNVQIYPSADQISADAALTQDDIITGPDTTEYQVPALDAGTYYFQCDVHPTMNGTWNVGGGGATGATGATGASGAGGATGATGASGGTGGGGAITVTAMNLAFDTDTIHLPANTEVTITFDNQDAATQHNIAIYTDSSATENLFRGDLLTGPGTIDYTIPALDPGTYYFRCDVHPTMNGTVVVG